MRILMPLALSLLPLGAPGLALAGPWDGTYLTHEGASCIDTEGEDGNIRVAEDVFFGTESACAMTAPVPVTGMNATLYTMSCSGEGETWGFRAMFMRDADGRSIWIVQDGFAFRYERCR